jgi:hypothetical protein
VFVLISAFAFPVLATYGQKQATLYYQDIKIIIDGLEITPKDVTGNIVEPFIIDGTTYLPLRATANAFGIPNDNISWDGSTSTITLISPVEEHAIYMTRTGVRYHYDNHCNGGTYWQVPLESALGMGLTPCEKCVK